jgi:MoxR-like ATPase
MHMPTSPTPEEALKHAAREISKVFLGKDEPIQLLLTGLVSGLAVLIEDIPGVGKTSLARSMAAACGLDFSRIQFTPDLLPGDISGMTIWQQESRSFVFKPGAIMHQFILADEINRASARTQSALLETMQEGSVSVDGITYPLPQPFFLVATQNPSGYSGTFHLPEAQLDRFGLSLSIGYPSQEHEREIGRLIHQAEPLAEVKPVLTAGDIDLLRQRARSIKIDDSIRDYVIDLAASTRNNELFRTGVSPRAGQHLLRAAQARALMEKRDYVLPEDVRDLILPVFSHRLLPTPQARLGGRTIQAELARLAGETRLPSGLR